MMDTCICCGRYVPEGRMVCQICETESTSKRKLEMEIIPISDIILQTKDYKVGDVCIYSFGNKNKSCSIVQIVKILNDERGIAEIKFLNVIKDDTGNGLFNFLLRTGGTMNASFEYLKNVTPRM